MTLSYSRDPFTRYVHRQDLQTFWRLHDEAFRHFGGVPGVILYDRTKTVVRRYVGGSEKTPLHPEAMAFASHYGFEIKLCAKARPQTKGRVERQVGVTRAHVLAGRTFTSTDEIKTYLKPAVLVLDEVGYLPLSRAEANMVFQLVSRRYERGSIILTSNKSFSEMAQPLGLPELSDDLLGV